MTTKRQQRGLRAALIVVGVAALAVGAAVVLPAVRITVDQLRSINSGWRSADEQQALIDDTFTARSVEEAQHLVAPVDRSAHVTGLAIDVGPPQGAQWLDTNGFRFGLCQVYENEPWHVEPLIAVGDECPPMYPDASVLW